MVFIENVNHTLLSCPVGSSTGLLPPTVSMCVCGLAVVFLQAGLTLSSSFMSDVLMARLGPLVCLA